MSPRAFLAAVAAVGCTPTLPRRFDHEHRGARVFRVEPAPAAPAGPGLAPARAAVPARGLTLVAEWGDDRWRFDAEAQRGPRLSGGRQVVWTAARFLVVDVTTGQPVRGFRWPDALAAAVPVAVVVGAGERLVAASTAGGAVWLGGLDGEGFAPLAPAPRAPAPGSAAPPEPQPPRGSVAVHPWDGASAPGVDDVLEAARRRLFFSRDGRRLAGGMSVWDVATRRPLLALRADEAALAVDEDAARVAVMALAVRTEVGTPGSLCGYIPVHRTAVVTAAEERTVEGAPLRPLASRSLAHPGASFFEPGVVRPEAVQARPVESVDVNAAGDVAAAWRDAAWRVSDRGARALSWPPGVRDLRRVTFAAGAVLVQAGLDGGAQRVEATAVFDAAGRAGRALAGGLEFAPNRAGRMAVRDERWSVWDALRMEPLRALPPVGPLRLGAIDQAMLTDAGAAVIREEAPGEHVLLVEEGASWRRVGVAAREHALTRWALAPDGGAAALHEPHALRVVDLRGGRERFRRDLAGTPTASVFQGATLYTADDRGRVSALAPDGTEVAHADLGLRFDHATALAVSPDGRWIAVGTARSRVFIFRVG